MPVDYEPFSSEWRPDPYAKYRELRDEAPVLYAPESKVWCVSRYDDVAAVLSDPETFSSAAMHMMLMDRGMEEPPPLSFKVLGFIARTLWKTHMNPGKFTKAGTLIGEDGEVHSARRKIVNRGFTPRRIADLEPRVREVAEECVENLETGSFDLMRELAIPLPVTMIAEMLGVESDRRDDFKRWSDNIIESVSTIQGREDLFNPKMTSTFIELVSYLRSITRARRKEPREDLISTIIGNHEGSAGLNDYEVMVFVMVLLIAGNETTTNLIGNATSALLDNPDELERLLANPELVAPALEEAVRFDAPIQLVFRTTTRDVEIAGVKIPKGAILAPLIGSANRDERKFTDPDRFDVERRPQAHLGFGFGKHFCLGSSLARLEAKCALEALLPKLPSLARAKEERVWVDSFLVRGPRRLPLERAA